MGSVNIPSGESREIISDFAEADAYRVIVESGDVRFSHTRTGINVAPKYPQGFTGTITRLMGRKLYAYADNADATVVLDDASFAMRDVAMSETAVSGGSSIDVIDRTGRDLGKARLMDSAGSLIDAGNPFPTSVEAWNAGAIDANVSGVTEAPQQPNLAFGETTVPTPGTAVQLNGGTSQTIPRGYSVAIQAQIGTSGDKVYVGDSSVSSGDGWPLADGQIVTLGVNDVAAVYVDADTANDSVCWIVEVQ